MLKFDGDRFVNKWKDRETTVTQLIGSCPLPVCQETQERQEKQEKQEEEERQEKQEEEEKQVKEQEEEDWPPAPWIGHYIYYCPHSTPPPHWPLQHLYWLFWSFLRCFTLARPPAMFDWPHLSCTNY